MLQGSTLDAAQQYTQDLYSLVDISKISCYSLSHQGLREQGPHLCKHGTMGSNLSLPTIPW